MTELELVSARPETTIALGHALGTVLSPGQVVFLRGELGSGKTTLVRALGAALGVVGPVVSPTFTVVQRYAGRIPLAHMDAYRLSGGMDDEETELFCDALGDGAIACVEWPQAVADRLPDATVTIDLEHAGGDRRLIRLTTHDPVLASALSDALADLLAGHVDP